MNFSAHIVNSPEMALLIACIAAEKEPSSIRNRAVEVLDWNKLCKLATRHQVTSLLTHTLSLHAKSEVPSRFLRNLIVMHSMIERKNQVIADELVRIDAVLTGAGIGLIHYKGATAASQLYGNLTLREFGDIDFLFQREHLNKLIMVLGSIGYYDQRQRSAANVEYLNLFEKDVTLRKGEIIVEPHWSLTQKHIAIQLDYSGMWERTVYAKIADTRVRTFCPEDLLLVLCICGAKGQWQRLQMIADVAHTAYRHPDMDWNVLISRSEKAGCARIVRTGLFTATQWLGTKIPTHADQWVRRDRKLPQIADRITNVLLGDKDAVWSTRGAGTFNRLIYSQHQGIRNKASYLVRVTTSPNNLHLRRVPLPSMLRWLYRIIVPLHDYVLWPLVKVFSRIRYQFRKIGKTRAVKPSCADPD